MKIIKKIICLFILICCVSINFVNTTVYAQEPEDNELWTCVLNIRIDNIDWYENEFTDDIVVVLSDVDANKPNNKYNFLLKENEGYRAGKDYGIIANTTYNVLILPVFDRFEFLDMQGYEITTIDAAAEKFELVLWMQEKQSYIEQNYIIIDHVNVYQEDPGTSKEEENIIDDFIDKTRFIENNDNFKIFLGNWSGAVYKKLYLEEQGKTPEDWENMTQYQRACYSLLYLLPKTFILGENSSIYAPDKNTFIKNLEVAQKPLEKLDKGTEVYAAITDVWAWHWDNWETSRIFYNPFESYTFSGENNYANVNDSDLPETERDVFVEVLDNLRNINNVNPNNNVRSELSNPNNFLNILNDNKITLIVLVIAGIVLFVVIYRNRKKNYDSENDEKNI